MTHEQQVEQLDAACGRLRRALPIACEYSGLVPEESASCGGC